MVKIRASTLLVFCFVLLPLLQPNARADGINLGTASGYAVLGEAGVTNTGNSLIYGSLAGSIGTPAITGFPPGMVVSPGVLYTTGVANNGLGTPFGDAMAAYLAAAAMTPTMTLTGTDLGNLILTPGVYFFASSAALTGTLTLNDQGNPNALFVFEIGSTLTTASGSSVVFINGGQDNNVWWQVGSSATLGTGTAFGGNVLADASVTLDTGASITCGSAIALGGSVTLDTNNVSTGGCAGTTSAPEPSSLPLLAIGLFAVFGFFIWRARGMGIFRTAS